MQTQKIATPGCGTTFAIHNVNPALDALELHKTRDIITRLTQGKTGALVSCSGYNSNSVFVGFHPFFAAVQAAYADHRPLAISPDMIWILIMQGLSQHVRNNAEQLRHKLVTHEGKKELKISRPDFDPGSPESDWCSLVSDWSNLLKAEIQNYDKLISNFSSTGALEKTVCEIVLMDTFSSYFLYVATISCGIPSLTLEGNLTDWKLLRERVEILLEFDMEWWLEDLRPILDQFCKAAEGNIDLKFWKNIYKSESCYTTTYINGWISRFVPYLRDNTGGGYIKRNADIGTPLDREEFESNGGDPSEFWVGSVTTDNIPIGISLVPGILIVPKPGSEPESMESVPQTYHFGGGFTSVTQDEKSLTLRPSLGWAVFKLSETDELVRSLPEGCTARTPQDAKVVSKKFAEVINEQVPRDFVAFYRQCDGLDFANKPEVRIYSLNELSFQFYQCDPVPCTYDESSKTYKTFKKNSIWSFFEAEILELTSLNRLLGPALCEAFDDFYNLRLIKLFHSAFLSHGTNSGDKQKKKPRNTEEDERLSNRWAKFGEFMDGDSLVLEFDDNGFRRYWTGLGSYGSIKPVYRVCRRNETTGTMHEIAETFSAFIDLIKRNATIDLTEVDSNS